MTMLPPQHQDSSSDQGLGLRLVAMRVASGLSQAQLAVLVGVPAEQIARDERTAYRGLTARAARRYLDVLAHDPRLNAAAAGASTPPSRRITSHYRALRLAQSNPDAASRA